MQNLAVPQNYYSRLSVLWNDLADPIFDGVGLAGFKSRANDFLLASAALSLLLSSPLFSASLFSVYRLVLWGWGLLTDSVYITLSQPCTVY